MAADDRADRLAGRYLEIVKAALLDEHYLENEVRLAYLEGCIERGQEPDPLTLRDPRSHLQKELERLRQSRRTGAAVSSVVDRPLFPFTAIGRSGLDQLQRCLEAVREESIAGDLAACGVWRGGVAIFLRAFLQAWELERARVWVADTFRGPPDPRGTEAPDRATDRFPNLVGDLNTVRDGFARFDLLDDRVRFLQGAYPETLADDPIAELALLQIGAEDEEAVGTLLERLYDKVVPGGFVLIEHYDAPGPRRAVDEFRARRELGEPLGRVDWAGASWRKAADRPGPPPPRAGASGARDRAPLAPPPQTASTELSVVVVFHDMRREAVRTLHSLSRAYQRGVEDLDYEVVVVENGSADDQRLGEELVCSFGPEFRYLDLGDESAPSPAPALNRGIAIARGEAIALMIDGAHLLSPGVLRFGMLGLATYEPAIVMTHQWYVGPGQQGEAMEGGYDKDYEDRLFERIEWPSDGYRLFEIGHFIGERDWFDGLWESNCIFTPRALLEQVGGFDETFSMPGGGYANLDLFERLGSTPGVTIVDIMGEASFHQLHGGTTTNQPDIGERHARLVSYREHYEQVRRRPFRGPGKRFHYVGSMFEAAQRTRPRRRTAPAFRQAQRTASDGMPEQPSPIPDELRAEYTDAFWRSLAWRQTTWLGRRIERPATDLLAYQELIDRLRPDWIVETRTAGGARATFLASICELVGSGRVLSISPHARGKRPEHPRIEYLTGPPTDEGTRRRVCETVGEGANAIVVIGAARRTAVVREFQAYASLVAVGSYVIVENTILNGHPVLPEHGPGPFEAVQAILRQRSDFAADTSAEGRGLTFNPGGFLRRVE